MCQKKVVINSFARVCFSKIESLNFLKDRESEFAKLTANCPMDLDVANSSVPFILVHPILESCDPKFLAYSGLVYAAAGKKTKTKKQHTEHERVPFLLKLNTRGY